MEIASCNKLVYVVDDDAGIRDALQELLLEEGYDVVTAEDGRDALDKLRLADRKPCLILLDLMMPVMNGKEFCAAKSDDKAIAEVPVVVITANGTSKREIEPFASDYLMKPMHLDQLLTTIEKHC